MKTKAILIIALLCAFAGMANAETVSYTIWGSTEQTGNVNFQISIGDSSTPVASTSWNRPTATSASVTDSSRGITLSFGTDKTSNGMAVQDALLISGNTSTGAYFTVSHGSKYIYHVRLLGAANQLITEAWNMTKS